MASDGLTIDIMIPNPESPEGIALGDQILAFAMSNAGHYDHVHITTTPRR